MNSCLKDIKPHLKRLNVAQKCVASEGELILARAGLFDGDVSGFYGGPQVSRQKFQVNTAQLKKIRQQLL